MLKDQTPCPEAEPGPNRTLQVLPLMEAIQKSDEGNKGTTLDWLLSWLSTESKESYEKIDSLGTAVAEQQKKAKELESRQVMQERNAQQMQREMTQKIQDLSSKGDKLQMLQKSAQKEVQDMQEEMQQKMPDLTAKAEELSKRVDQSWEEKQKIIETQNKMSQMIESLTLEASTCSQKIDDFDPLVKQLESQQVLQESNLQRIQKEMTQKIQDLSSKGESHLQALATQQESAKKHEKFQVSTLKKLEESKEEMRRLSSRVEQLKEAASKQQSTLDEQLEMQKKDFMRLVTQATWIVCFFFWMA